MLKIMKTIYKTKWANFLSEAKKVDFDVIEKYITNYYGDNKQAVNFGLDAYMDSLKNSFRLRT